MKRFIAILLCMVLLLTGCYVGTGENNVSPESADALTELSANETVDEPQDIVSYLAEQTLNPKNESDGKNVAADENLPNVPFDQAQPDLFEQGIVEYSDETVLIKLKNSVGGAVTEELKRAGVAKLELLFELSDAAWYTAFLNTSVTAEGAMEAIRAAKGVVVAEYNFKYETALESVDSDVQENAKVQDQWYLKHCGISDGWGLIKNDKNLPGGGNSSVVVAVIDTGVDYEHEDLKNNIWRNMGETPNNNVDDDGNGYVDDYYGVDMTTRKGSGMDDHGHGTHVAGIIAAENNKTGVVGVAYNTKIMPIKAGSAAGYFLQSDIAEAVIYAYEHGADVINMSFGGSAFSIAVQDALEIAYTRCVLVASAGNEGAPNEHAVLPSIPNYPAAAPYVLGVMSVGQTYTESSFSNWDSTLYNAKEYEVYAPGEQIMSTTPGNKYAKLSGTSMAAPIVAAQAAILRSYFNDRDTHPTKFIYGQIVGTADNVVSCYKPEDHGTHNIPGLVNIGASITELPTPDVGISDYTIFDSESFAGDTAGLTSGCLSNNNGDGVIDAGETIALGFTLKNRWGMGENTKVSVSAQNELGVECPYVTFLNNDLGYGSVGTYSETDSGKLFSEDGEVWTGWQNPFYIQISKDTPNNYTIPLTFTVTTENALNPEDNAVYTSHEQVLLVVRRGILLPNLIEEDMTLTKDNYYIIPNATLIKEGATLTITEGTKVQFWTDDPNDAYAESAITYLRVDGRLIVKGTAEEPVELFPSDWMSEYLVKIQRTNEGGVKGYISMEHATVTNPYLTIDKAVHCTFKQNYKDQYNDRVLSAGTVQEYEAWPQSTIDYAEYCTFYKVGGRSEYERFHLYGDKISGCVFVDSACEFECQFMVDNLFYGNNNFGYEDPNEMGKGSNSHIEIDGAFSSKRPVTFSEVLVDRMSGTTYIRASHQNNYSYSNGFAERHLHVFNQFANTLGGGLISLDSVEEFKLIQQNYDSGIQSKSHLWLGVRHDKETGVYYNYDGTVLPAGIPVEAGDRSFGSLSHPQNTTTYSRDTTVLSFSSSNSAHVVHDTILEIPGAIYMTEIKLDKYLVDIDMNSTHQIEAQVVPVTADAAELVYTSEDESIVKVDENGGVTPVAVGSANIRVYSPDYAIYNYVTVNVKEEVVPTAVSVTPETVVLSLGETCKLTADFEPANTTKRELTYESSDSAIASVNARGVVTAHAVGDAVITATGYDGISDTVAVHCVVPAEKLYFEKEVYTTSIETEDGTAFYPVIEPENTTDTDLSWESSNPEVCYVDEAGALVKRMNGVARLKATLPDTGLSAELQVVVSDETFGKVVKMQVYAEATYALTDDGSIWVWGNTRLVPERLEGITDAKDFQVDPYKQYSNDLYYLNDAGEVREYNYTFDGNTFTVGDVMLRNIVKLADGVVRIGGQRSMFAISSSGAVWAWGCNDTGQLGDGTTVYKETPVQVAIEAEIVKVVANDHFTLFMDADGNVYGSGQIHGTVHRTPTLLADGAEDIYQAVGSYQYGVVDQGDVWIIFNQNDRRVVDKNDPEEIVGHANGSGTCSYRIEDDTVYVSTNIRDVSHFGVGEQSDNVFTDVPMVNIRGAEKVFVTNNNTYVQTADGFYACGTGAGYRLGNASTEDTNVHHQVIFGVGDNNEALLLEGWSGEAVQEVGYTVTGNTITFDFNEAIIAGNANGGITLTDSEGLLYAVNRTFDLDKLVIGLRRGMIEGAQYTITVPENAVMTRFGMPNKQAFTRTFTWYPGEEALDDAEDAIANETVTDEDKLAERHFWTSDEVMGLWAEYVDEGRNTTFHSNAIINRLNDDNVMTWMRVQGEESGTYSSIGIAGNYWGTQNDFLIGKQILDFDDYQTLSDLNEGAFITEAPSNTFPFVVDAWLEVNGERVDTVGNDLVTFVVQFNRAMDQNEAIEVLFGSTYPYADYEIEGAFVSDTEWRGETQLTTLIENGYQYWTVRGGKAAGTDLKHYEDWGRFPFKIDTSAAQALIMQAEVRDNGINLTWEQDDFETLIGYNVYRSTSEDGLYTRINRTVIPADTKELFDDTVEPAVTYYYNFTVVTTDLTESEPSGKVMATSFDTMAPDIYHSPVYHAFTGGNLVVSATVTDNVGINAAKVFYRVKGTAEWHETAMSANNDKYSAIIPSEFVTTAGLEYYIEATDGISFTYKASADAPYEVMVQLSVAASDIGDVDGNGAVQLKDAVMLLMAVNDRLNLTEEQFARADIDASGELSAMEALRIIQFVNGKISSVAF